VDQIAEADDRVERGAKLMAHGREERRLGPTRCFCLVARLDQESFDALVLARIESNRDDVGHDPVGILDGTFRCEPRAQSAMRIFVVFLDGADARSGLDGLTIQRACVVSELRPQEIGGGAADRVMRRGPEQRRVIRVHQDVSAVAILAVDHRRDGVDQRLHGRRGGHRVCAANRDAANRDGGSMADTPRPLNEPSKQGAHDEGQ
jgi:hypothetical protein